MPRVRLPDLVTAVSQYPNRVTAMVADALPACRVVCVAGVRRDVAAGLSPDGTPFAPLAHPRPAGGDQPLRSTGLMVNSASCAAEGDELVLRANHPAARLHQLGGVIVPANGKALSLPLTREAARAGGARNFPRKLVYLPMRSANPDSRGKLAEVVFKGRGRKQKPVLVVHYLLRSRVVVPARRWLGFSARTVEQCWVIVRSKLKPLGA